MVWVKRISLTIVIIILVLILLLVGALLYFHIPSNGAGMAAKGVCSATFVAGRNDGQDTFTEDILPASPVFTVISTNVDQEQHSVTAKFLGLFERRASLLNDRGCVLDEDPQPSSVPYTPPPVDPAQWPAGDASLPAAELAAAAPKLDTVLDQAMQGAGDPNGVNARGVAIVQDGKLLATRHPQGFPAGTALHGWSMTKTVAAMLFYKRASEVGLSLQTPVIDAFPAGRAPAWVADWRNDDRKNITVADLAFMRSGLDISESYQPWGDVVQMLYGEPNMAAWAAGHSLVHQPGTFWEYTSGGSNIFSAVTMGQFASPQEYWAYSKAALFDPIGADSATLETDTSGTWVGSSFLWASVEDWARLGQLMLADGKWNGQQVLPPGWLAAASQPALPSGDGHGYGLQTWLPGDSVGGECKAYPGVPRDTLSMDGHWGQVVAMVPSRNAVITRLGWTVNAEFDECQFISDVLAALPR